MRIIQTVNDTIRLLFNPKTEVFSLSDFLLVRDNSENFLAQVVEVYDDKFDQEANVAKIKLIYRIINGNEIVPYDNYTPSRECEVAKIKQSEIEKCINLNKKTLSLGTSFKTKEKTEINTDFFDNNCVIFADKYEQTNQIFENLAPRLSEYKNVLILDFSGSCIPENAVSYKAADNFRLPLSSKTIDYIQQKTLLRAKLETQVVLGDVFEEVKNFLASTEEDYIPFSRFIKVIQSQCRQTPSVELLVLISWLKKYSRHGIFAKNIREAEALFKSVEKNKITTLDLSNLKIEWQKEYVEYITKTITKDVFVLIRLNDNNINNDILNSIYFKSKNISFIPSFAYGYKKVSYIMDFAQNYILMPTLNPKRDFTHATFQIQSLNKESYMIFGEDTKDFIFIIENKSPVKKRVSEEDDSKDKMFISLNLQLEDMTALELRPNNFEVKPAEIKKKRLQEEIRLEDVLKIQDKEEEPSKKDEEETTEAQTEPLPETPVENDSSIDETLNTEINEETETAEKIPQEEPVIEKEIAPENVLGEDELDYFDESSEYETVQNEEPIQEAQSEFYEVQNSEEIQEAIPAEDEINNEETAEVSKAVENGLDEEYSEETEPVQKEEIIEAEIIEEEIQETVEPETTEQKDVEPEIEVQAEKEPEQEENLPKIKDTAAKLVNAATDAELAKFAEVQSASYDENDNSEDETNENKEEADKNEVMDDTLLDAIDEANGVKQEEPIIGETKEAVSSIIKEVVKEKTQKEEIKSTETKEEAEKPETKEEAEHPKEVKAPKNTEENVSAEKEADEANAEEKEETAEPETSSKEDDEIEKKFKEIMSEEQVKKTDEDALKVNDKVSIDLNKIKKEVRKNEPKLPVFTDEEDTEPAQIQDFKEGDSVYVEKYGAGKILKIVNFRERQLLKIEFSNPELTPRLLDPKMAKLKILEDV